MILLALYSGILEFSFPYWFPVYKSETDRLLNEKETRNKRVPSIDPLTQRREMDLFLPLVPPSSEACVLRIPWISVIRRSPSFPSTRRPTVGATSLKLPMIRRKRRPRSTSSPFLILHWRAASPLEFSQPMAESLLGVEIIPEVVGPVKVVMEVGVRAPSVRHAPAVPAITPVLPPSEQAALWPVLGAAAVLLMPSVRQWAQVMVGWPTGIALRDKKNHLSRFL